jgi:mannobiose 2-epimerase
LQGCLFAAILLNTGLSLCAQPLTVTQRRTYAQEVEQAFLQLVSTNYPLVIDRQNGGFYTTFSHEWKLTGNQDKMIVTQARHTWLPAKASQIYPSNQHIGEAAEHGFRFLKNSLWDQSGGGFFTWATAAGKPRNPDDLKTAYGNAFGLFALAAYYETTGDTAALDLAKKAFYWLEEFSHDARHKGYFQNLMRDGTPAHLSKTAGKGMYGPLHYKDQNSSIHLLEAFTELYRVWPDPLLRDRTEEMLTLIRDRITTERGYLTLFLTPDWKPVSYRDSSEAARKANYAVDHVSFGHDVETAYLMMEASHVLGLENDKRTPLIAKKMVDHALRNGFDPKMGGFYERGYYFKGAKAISIIDSRKNWWAQAEGLNTLLLMALKYPDDPMQYGEKFRKQWEYAQRYLIDKEHGGWYEWGLDKTPGAKTDPKAHAWKAAYHDGRSLMNMLQNLRPDNTPPPAPDDLNVKKSESGGLTVQWSRSTDDRNLRGYDVYYAGKRIGFTPLSLMILNDPAYSDPALITVVARDVQGNISPAARVAGVK